MAVQGGETVSTTSSTTDIQIIRTRLVSSVALNPSLDWLRACMDHLQKKHNRSNNNNRRYAPSADEVLFQVLYSDLRDVVRPVSLTTTSNDNEATVGFDFLPSKQLREKIVCSSQANHNYTQILPESFQLMCQLEEVADVAKSAEHRLGGINNNNSNANNTNNNTNNNNQHGPRGSSSRCSKVCLSDGHEESNDNASAAAAAAAAAADADADADADDDAAAFVIVGIETTPIQGLSASSSLAGTKVLLRGPLEIRHGILLLHPGNFVLLGGCCRVLVEHQTKAMEANRKDSGFGIDPTIRALIGNGGYNENENDDEAHEASGDVVVADIADIAVVAVAVAASAINENANNEKANNENANTNIHNHQAPGSGLVQPPSQRPQQPQNQQQIRSISLPTTNSDSDRSSISNNGNNNNSSRSPPAAGRKRNASQISNHSSNIQSIEQQTYIMQSSIMQTTSSSTAPHLGATRNPYAGSGRTRTQQTISNVANTNTNPYHRGTHHHQPEQQQQQQQQKQQQPPQMRKRPAAPESAEPATGATTSAARITPIANHHHIPNHNSSNNNGQPQSNNDRCVQVATQGKRNNENETAIATATATATAYSERTCSVQNMNFANLRMLLLELVGNRDMYESYYQRKIAFRVELSVPDSNQFFFDVVKIPKEQQQQHNISGCKSPSKKNKKKYAYFTSARFGSCHDNGDGNGDDSSCSSSVACRIHPDLLESCFEVSANDLRALSRTDRQRCTSITNGGGEAVKQTYFAPRVWRATLHLSTDRVFGETEQVGKDNNNNNKLGDLKNPLLLLEKDPLP